PSGEGVERASCRASPARKVARPQQSLAEAQVTAGFQPGDLAGEMTRSRRQSNTLAEAFLGRSETLMEGARMGRYLGRQVGRQLGRRLGRRLMFVMTAGFALIAAAQTSAAVEPTALGLWQKTENGKPVIWVLVTERNGVYEGAIAKIFGPPPADNAAR